MRGNRTMAGKPYRNIRCCKEIDKAVSESFDGYSLSDSGAESVIARFGYDRAMWYLRQVSETTLTTAGSRRIIRRGRSL